MVRLEHIGIAVQDAGAVAALFETLLGVLPYKQEAVAREGVQTHFLATTSAKLELLESLGSASPIAGFLEKRGEGLHHLAFEVADVEATFARLQQRGFQLLGEAPRPGADGKRIFFVHPKQTHGVLVEFCQSVPTPLPTQAVATAAGTRTVCVCGAAYNPALLVVGDGPDAPEVLLRRLEPFFHVLAPLPPCSVPDLRAVLDHFGVQRTTVLALERGTAPAGALVQAYPERIAGWITWRADTGGIEVPAIPALHITDQPSQLRASGTPVLLPPATGDLPDLDVLVPLVRGWQPESGIRAGA